MFFVSIASAGANTAFYRKLKKRTLLVIEGIKNESKETENAITEIDDLLLSWYKPKVFYGSMSAEVLAMKGFEETCIILKKNNVADNPKSLTTLAYFEALEVVKKINKK